MQKWRFNCVHTALLEGGGEKCAGSSVHGDLEYSLFEAGGIIIGGILYWTVVIPEIMEGAELNEYWSIIHAPLFGAIWLLTILMVCFLLCNKSSTMLCLLAM